MSLDHLKDLNEIGRGVDKHWIYRDLTHQELAHDYMQKINYSIQDINYLIGDSGRIERRTDVVSLIVMVDWIASSVWQYKSCLSEDLLDSFQFTRQENIKECCNFLKALRSFVVAHPLNTDQHDCLGFDGDLICVDMRTSRPALLDSRDSVQRFGINGIEPYDNERSDDVYLYVYSKKANAQCFEFLIVDLADAVRVAQVYIDKLYEIDKYLCKLKKKDYIVK